MKLLYSLLKQDSESRDGVVITTSVLGILVNLLLGTVKIAIGAAVSSIAIISEGVNNATDCASSLITIVGTKLAGKKPTKKHPFGYGRIEYLTSLIISLLIFVTGFELLKSSVELIFNPSELKVSYVSMFIIALSAAVKLALGSYTIRMGKQVDSGSLIAVGTDCKNDSVISAVTIASALIFLLFDFSVDAYAGIFTSVFVLKAGYEVLSDTVSNLLGKPANEELAIKLYKEIRSNPFVINAADLMLHNYGPDSYSGSVNIEVDRRKTVGEIYASIHELQLRIMHDMGVTMVFGLYAVDQDSDDSRKMRSQIAEFVRNYEHIVSYHALYLATDERRIYCDLVVDYGLEDWDKLRENFTAYMAKLYPDDKLELTIETEYV